MTPSIVMTNAKHFGVISNKVNRMERLFIELYEEFTQRQSEQFEEPEKEETSFEVDFDIYEEGIWF